MPENETTENSMEYDGDSAQQNSTEGTSNPSAEFLVNIVLEDYQRVQNNYLKMYDKINVALAVVGIILTILLGSFDLSTAKLIVTNLAVWQIILISLKVICTIGSLLLIIIALIMLLTLLKGKTISLFKSEDVRNEKLYKADREDTAMWLIDKYSIAVAEMRPVIQEKQKGFDRSLILIIIGVILYAIAIILQKGGF